jgi:DNA repair protein RecN (Recombination protein N)
MIRSLKIRNYAIVRDLDIDLDSGLTILSGETGAGKSILIGALNLILGERASSEAVRAGEDLAVVEAEISELPRSAADELRRLDVEFDGDAVTFRREVQAKGASRAFVNGRMVALGALKKIAATMFDLVGQHQQQYLIDTDHHVSFLDNFGNLTGLCDDVRIRYELLVGLKAELERMQDISLRQQQMVELYRFQIQEIEQADLSGGEEESLLSEKKVLENAEKLRTTLTTLSDMLATEDDSITSKTARAESMLREAAEIDSSLSDSLESLTGSRFVLEDVGRTLASRAQSIEADPNRLQQIEDRLDVYYNLKKKYGGSLEALNEYHEKIKTELNSDVDLSARIEEIEGELHQVRTKLTESALELSEKRGKHAALLSKKIEREIAQLGITKGQFDVRVVRREYGHGLIESKGIRYRVERDGIDDVEFYFCANRGEELRPLAKIASGGELSRVMLALKTVGATRKKLETLIFDEVDSGIGGEVAAAVGKKLRHLARKHQILVITHLQQIAAAGDHHYKVYKEKSDGRMITKIKRLTEDDRRQEIGRMLSGDKLTETSLRQAEELLEQFE